jgi:GH24 family phage-related lysozyme (muramidase)
MANRQIRSPGEIARFDARGQISGDVPSFAVYQGQASEVLANVGAGLSKQLGKLADDAAAREGALAGLTAGQQSGAAYLQSRAVGDQAAGAAGTGPWMEQAKALLRKEEGFRETPYFDVTAHRVGYGSDTTVTADGKVVRVSKGMKVSREDAERDLNHRLMNVEGARARNQLGPSWDTISESGKAALVSVAYNYGSLPSSVVKAARTGDASALAAAVGGLAVNKARRGREAAMILGGGGPGPASKTDDAAIVTGSTKAPVSTEAVVPLSTEPLALRRDGTIRGEAMDRSAASAYAWRVQEGLSRDLYAAHEQFQDDPAGFQAAAEKVRDTYLQDEAFQDPEIRELFDKGFAERSEAYARSVANNHEKNLRNEEQAAYAGGLAAQQVDLERQAQVLGATPEGDRIVGERVASMQNSIDAAVSSGTITAAQGLAAKNEVVETGARGRIQGVYEALPSPERKRTFALSLLDDWKKGDGPLSALPFATVKGISDTLRRDAQSLVDQGKAANKVEAARLTTLIDDDVSSVTVSGKGLDTDAAGLSPARVQEILGPEKFAAWQVKREKAGKIFDAAAGMETQTSDDIAERLELIAPKPGTPGFADQQDVFEAAQKQATTIIKARADDPATAVQKAFPNVKQLADDADPQDPSSMQALVAARLQAQDAIGIADLAREPLTKPEAVNLARSVTLQADPKSQSDAIISLVGQVSAAYGPHADAVLTQVLGVTGFDKEMAQNAAAQFRRLSAGGSVTRADRRQTGVIDETAVAERTAQPSTTPTGRSANLAEIQPSSSRQSATMPQIATPNIASIQHLRDNPQLASQFEALYGPGSARQYLPAVSGQ